MATPMISLFGVDIKLNVSANTEHLTSLIQAAVGCLVSPNVERLERLEDMARKTSTLLREFREGLDALTAKEKENADRVIALEALVAELQARESLTPQEKEFLDAMVTELARRTGNVMTDDESQIPAE